MSDSEIINRIKARFTLTQEQAEEYVLPKETRFSRNPTLLIT